jgi:hypothetical protein
MRGFLTALLLCAACRAADVADIIPKATLLINSDWAADPKFACVETDAVIKNGKTTSKSYLVVMIEGSDYRFPVAVDGQALSAEREKAELVKFKAEIEKRKAEILPVRKRRINDWKAKRDENGELLLDFPIKSDFKLLREEIKRDRPAYVLSATPKPGLVATDRTTKVYAGMEATVWVDKETLQPIYIECHVVRPVPIYGPLASVLPGTKIEIGMVPVTGSVWLIDLVTMKLDLAKIKLFKSTETTATTYAEYRPNDAAVKELLSKANAAGLP